MKKYREKIREFFTSSEGKQTIRYGIIGVCTTAVSFISYYVLYDRVGIRPEIANVISVILAILFAYVTNKLYVFQSKTHNLKEFFSEFVKFIGSRAVTMVFEMLAVPALIAMTIHEMLAKLAVTVFVIVGNYFLSKLFVFTTKKAKE